MAYELGEVPCGNCQQCCHDLILLTSRDDENRYKTMPHPLFRGKLALARSSGGGCYHLTEQGCSIYEHRPEQCRLADCRVLAHCDKELVTKFGWTTMQVYRKGQEMQQRYPLYKVNQGVT